MIVIHGGSVIHAGVLPIGGNHLTNDVAAGLRTPAADAEKLKIDYGVATSLIVRATNGAGAGIGGPSRASSRAASSRQIIEPRMEEILAMAQRELMRSGSADSLASGLVLVGGTSLLEGTQELAERVFNLTMRRGLATN